FDVVAVFDASRERIGARLGDLAIEPMDRLGEVCRERAIEIGVIAVPARAAQEAAEALARAGGAPGPTFRPGRLACPRGVKLRDVNLAVELESLAFALRAAGPK